jgi:HEPN domain-containing protein
MKKNRYEAWFRKALEDELSTKAVLDNGAPSTGCFLAQQMAEKYLKGLMVYLDQDFPKVHDLLGLGSLLLKQIHDVSTIHHDLQVLNRYYIETRYPGDYPEFTLEECQEAFKAALRVKDFVIKKVKKYNL